MKKVFLYVFVIFALFSLSGCSYVFDEEIDTDKEITDNKIEYLKDLTNDNIGDFIDFGESLNGEIYKWRVFLNDTEKGKVYVIMADYLPVKDIEKSEKMVLIDDYYVSFNKSILGNSGKPEVKDNKEAAQILSNENNWSYLIPKSLKDKAIAKGGISYDEFEIVNSKKEDLYDLESMEGYPDGYWFSTAVADSSSDLFSRYCFHKTISHDNMVWKTLNGLRPILIINSDLMIEKNENIWYLR